MSNQFDNSSFEPAAPKQSHGEEVLKQRFRAQVEREMGTRLSLYGDQITDYDLRQKLDMPPLDANGQPVQMLKSAFSDIVKSSGKLFAHDLLEGCASLGAEYCLHHAREYLMPTHAPHAVQVEPTLVEKMVSEMSQKHGITLTTEQHKQLTDIFTNNMQSAIEQSIVQVGQTQAGFSSRVQQSHSGGVAGIL